MNKKPALEQIRNFYHLDEHTGTAGQPEAEEFQLIRQNGYKLVINLACHDSPHALENEARIAEKEGLEYIHLPVDFKAPTLQELEQFFTVMQRNDNRPVFVHCALNWRVSCFMYLYRTIRKGIPENIARNDLLQVWQPDQTWQDFIETAEKQLSGKN